MPAYLAIYSLTRFSLGLNTEVRSEICLTWSACTVAPLNEISYVFPALGI